jgi:uncharacterized Fe-S cluster-containing radical SAM superfamily protein
MIGTPEYNEQLRSRTIDLATRRLMVSRLAGSDQEGDLSEPVNCNGLGRVRHFGRATAPPWPANDLPGSPARSRLKLLGLGPGELQAQVFQNAACNWRCWYCFVPFNLLGAHEERSEWKTAEELVDLWRAQSEPAPVLDLSGGQPDLVPEWVPWTMRALRDRGLERTTYLWSDDNLSTDYFWRHLTDEDISLIGDYANYGRAVSFKGIDEASFVLNTSAPPASYLAQFEFARRLLDARIDLYCCVMMTTVADTAQVPGIVARFMDRLQEIHENLPLRAVPLQVSVFGSVRTRIRADQALALERQETAVRAWNDELASRYSAAARQGPIHKVAIRRG